ncbi:PcfB family protein [Mediannikoviicoccus vaginalis]|uniref:PcfB family protein n=1 Tax=Mediannikoviicoccus vaginalis TaxID=2899727 RepID=UPI001F372BAA|nr:PcfB family protein [Mediannikoviicoccus vaginalis]
MVNDEVNNKAINIEIRVAQYSAKAILKSMKKIIEYADEKSQPLADYISEKRKTNSRKLKDMVKKGQLENIDEQIENKFYAFKDYAYRRKINWGFVRDKDTRLYINNTNYTKEMNNENRKRLEDLF